jgi:hypothetical protein
MGESTTNTGRIQDKTRPDKVVVCLCRSRLPFVVMTDERQRKLVGRKVRELRLKSGFTQEDMRDHGFGYRYYKRIEAGEKDLRMSTGLPIPSRFQSTTFSISTRITKTPVSKGLMMVSIYIAIRYLRSPASTLADSAFSPIFFVTCPFPRRTIGQAASCDRLYIRTNKRARWSGCPGIADPGFANTDRIAVNRRSLPVVQGQSSDAVRHTGF